MISKPQPKQLLLSEIFPPIHGGSGRWFYEVYRRLDPGNFLMVVQESSQDTHEIDSHYPHPILRENLHVDKRILSNWTSIRRYQKISGRLRNIVRQHHVSAIHAGRPLHEGLVARWMNIRYGIPYVCFIHGEDINVAMTSRELRILTGSVLANSRRLIANSSYTKGLLMNDWKVHESKIEMIHPGVDTSYFVPPTQELDRPTTWQGKFVILTVGRLQQRKGHDMVLRAIAMLKTTFPELLYVIAGQGEEQLTHELGVADITEFVGAIDDESLRSLYRNCDLFVLANRSIGNDVEGFGMVLVEAQSCGKPVIAGKSGGTSDTMDIGESGFVIDCTSPQLLAESIRVLIENPEQRKHMGFHARKYTMDNFDWDTLANKAESLFSRLLT